ncbi:hypothetical protein SCLCIDRAFT_1209777 [Scleroderma citrinum Foug A]|uniref:Uncharacterized protein n=1 Tax=Scleroderma citrinum Foug A TaxID=1036808 RepID=A0A0C3A1Z6_9AGAM|nr:hypothetical protein SCLCIDRAFT_1209777 [Scleroderma citrinum Foug A]
MAPLLVSKEAKISRSYVVPCGSMPVTTSEARQCQQEIQWRAAFPPPFPHSMYHTKDVLHHEHERKEDDSVVSVIDHLTQGRLFVKQGFCRRRRHFEFWDFVISWERLTTELFAIFGAV